MNTKYKRSPHIPPCHATVVVQPLLLSNQHPFAVVNVITSVRTSRKSVSLWPFVRTPLR